MQAKTFRKPENETQTVQRVIRNPKTQDEIKNELRVQRALDTRRRTIEDYLTPNTRPFGV